MDTGNQNDSEALLQVHGLKTYFFSAEGIVQAVDGVDFQIMPGETLALVGESGCGKSVTALSILRLIDPPGRIVEGAITFRGQNLTALDEREVVKLRGNAIAMIFQQPTSCLNPVFRIGEQVAEALINHQHLPKDAAWAQAVAMLHRVGLPNPEVLANAFPHEISGGQAQRVMIAMMLANRPQLLIADEPTTALDVTIQAQILDLMRQMRKELGTAILLITHNLGVVAEMADSVAVMYAGQIVEATDVYRLFDTPQHPYTQGLLKAIPILGSGQKKLDAIPGVLPNPRQLPPGCRFAARCRARLVHNLTRCTVQMPSLMEVKSGHWVRCWLYADQTNISPTNPGETTR